MPNQETAISAQTQENQSPKKSNKKLLVFISIPSLIIIVLIVFSISATNIGKVSLNQGIIPNVNPTKNQVYRVLAPKPIESQAVSKLITAKEGGELKLNGEKGEEITLFVPPNALDKDTTLKMSPLSEVPIKNYTSSQGNGVLIEPVSTMFKIPASIIFDSKPEKQPDPFAQMSGSTQKSTGQPESNVSTPEPQINIDEAEKEIKALYPDQELNFKNVQGVQTERTPSPTPQIPTGGPFFTGSGGIIHTDPNTGDASISLTTTSSDGSKVSAPVDSGGTQTPDKIDGEKANNFAKQAMGNFVSSCSPQNTQLLFNALKYSRAAFDASAYGFAMAGINQCLDEKLKEVQYQCKNDKISLRRNTFEAYKAVAAAFRLDGTRQKFQDLEDQCTAEFSLYGENSVARNSGIIKYSLEAASECGYIDDSNWGATENSDITVPGTPAHMVYKASSKFALPPGGGSFYVKGSGNVYANTIAGTVNFPMDSTTTLGYFNNQKNVIFTNVIQINAPITIKTESCVQSAPINPNFYNPNNP